MHLNPQYKKILGGSTNIYFYISKIKRKIPNKLTWQLDALSKLNAPAKIGSQSTVAQSFVNEFPHLA